MLNNFLIYLLALLIFTNTQPIYATDCDGVTHDEVAPGYEENLIANQTKKYLIIGGSAVALVAAMTGVVLLSDRGHGSSSDSKLIGPNGPSRGNGPTTTGLVGHVFH